MQEDNLLSARRQQVKRRPRLRWLHWLLKGVKTLEVNEWWKKARDKDLWSEIIKEVKAHKGL